MSTDQARARINENRVTFDAMIDEASLAVSQSRFRSAAVALQTAARFGTFESMMQASEYVRVIEDRQGFKVGCIEEIAWRAGWIDDQQLAARAAPLAKSGYGLSLQTLLGLSS